MRTLNRKKALRKVNKVVREFNEEMRRDNLWRGRFWIRQKEFYVKPYFDNSGLQGVVVLEFHDLKTGYVSDKIFDLINFEAPFTWHIGRELNTFITEECDVWRKEGSVALYSDTTVYRP